MDRTKKCRLQFKKVSIQNRREFKHMPNSHWNKASNHTFQDKSVVNTHPNREGCRHMLKSSELGQGWQKALWSLDWPDQESNLHPVSTKCARETHKGKKNWKETARSSGDTSEGQKYKLSLIPATKYGNDTCLGCSSTARKWWHMGLHHSYMDILLKEKWMLRTPALDSQDLVVLLTHALGMTLGHIPLTIRWLLYLSQPPMWQ